MATASLCEGSMSQGSPSPMRDATYTPQDFISSLPKKSRMPREGPTEGGGVLTVKDRTVYETQVRAALEAESDELLALPEVLRLEEQRRSRQGRRPSVMDSSARSHSTVGEGRSGSRRSEARRSGYDGDSPRSSAAAGDDGSNKRLDPRERKQQEMYFKWQKAEALRSSDRKAILERIERAKDARDARFKRLLSSVMGEGNMAQETAKTLRERSVHEEQRRRELHDEWERNVHWPMVEQMERQLNPPDRALAQRRAGRKSVGWTLPDDEFKLKVRSDRDPSRRVLADQAYDNAFHEAASQLLAGRTRSAPSGGLGRSASAPQLQGPAAGPARAGFGSIPRARSKHVLDPTVWTQEQYQGTLYGFWAQVCESGEGFKRCLKGGPDAHIPDTSDGVMAAGTRLSRAHGRNDMGILKGLTASRGEAAGFKQGHGSSCGAPTQDHFTFEHGPGVTDLEFPLGKRPPPPGTCL